MPDCYSGEELFGDVAEFDVRLLGAPDEDVEGAVGENAIGDRTIGLLGRAAEGGEVGDGVDCFGDGVEAGTADGVAVFVEEAVADDYDRAGDPSGGDHAVAAAERSAGGVDRVQCVGEGVWWSV